MAIDIDGFFQRFGKAVYAAQQLLASSGATFDTNFQALLDAFNSDPIKFKQTIENLIQNKNSLQLGVSSQLTNIVRTPFQQLLEAYVDADVNIPGDVNVKLREFIRQMEVGEIYVTPNVVGTVVAPDGTPVGDGTFDATTVGVDGRDNELAFDEVITLECTEATEDNARFSMVGEQFRDYFSYEYPLGSGLSSTLQVNRPSESATSLPTPTLETPDPNDPQSPLGWIGTEVADTVVYGDTSVQSVEISGSPTSGHYLLLLNDRFGREFVTDPIPWNGDAGTIQTSIRKINGFSQVTVATTAGSSPNFTHQITFNGVPNPGPVGFISYLDTGAIAIATVTTGADSLNGSKNIEIRGDGSERTTWYIPVNSIGINKGYEFHMKVKELANITSGVLQVGLMDGIDGNFIKNGNGDDQVKSWDLSLQDGTWQTLFVIFSTPSQLPDNVYLIIRCNTAIDAAGILAIDSVFGKSLDPVYPGGPIIQGIWGTQPFAVGDRFTVTVSNTYAGQFLDWMDRVFFTRVQDVKLPTTGTTLIPPAYIGP